MGEGGPRGAPSSFRTGLAPGTLAVAHQDGTTPKKDVVFRKSIGVSERVAVFRLDVVVGRSNLIALPLRRGHIF